MSRGGSAKGPTAGARQAEYECARLALERLLLTNCRATRVHGRDATIREQRARLVELQALLDQLTQEFRQRTEAARARWPRSKVLKTPDDIRGSIAAGWGDSNVVVTREKMEASKAQLRIRGNPDDAEAHYDLAVASRHLGSYQEAVEACKEAIRLRPDFAEAYCNLGVVYAKLGDYQEALGALEEAIRLRPDDVRARYNLGITTLVYGARGAASDEQSMLDDLDGGLVKDVFLGPDYTSATSP